MRDFAVWELNVQNVVYIGERVLNVITPFEYYKI